MPDPLVHPAASAMSQGAAKTSTAIERDSIDVSSTRDVTISVPEPPKTVAAQFRDNPPLSTISTTATKQSRRRLSYASKKVLAKSWLLLNPSFAHEFVDNEIEILGQIRECPRASNGHRFRMD